MKKATRIFALAMVLCLVLSLGSVGFAAGVTWEDYQEYLYNASLSNAPDAQEWHDQVYALSSWDDIDLSTSPWDMIFSESGPNLTTWEEFQATGAGAATSAEGSEADSGTEVPSDSGDKKDEGVPSAEPAAEAASAQDVSEMTVSEYGSLNNFSRSDAGYVYVGYDVIDGELTENSNWEGDPANIVLDNEVTGAGFTAVHAEGDSVVNVTGSITLTDDEAGEHASDFSGVGSVFSIANGATAYIKDMTIYTEGFVRAAVVLDNEAIAWVENCDIVTLGANPLTEAYDGYVNSATTSKMLSPPWVLGIQGGIRTMNVLDNNATLIVKDSSLSSGGWGVISTDGCTNPVIYVIDSELTILPESEGGMDSGWKLFGFDEDAYGSGYGAYIIGNVDEDNFGVTISGATFGAICREGAVSYQSSNGDIALTSGEGEDLGTVTGKGQVSTINCVFGAMTHSSEDVTIEYLDGTIVNSEMATILYRSTGNATFIVDEAELNPGNGIILQMIDDDDSTVGMGDMNTMGFNTSLVEAAGMPSTNGNETGASSSNEQVIMTLTNGEYTGNFYNGTGYYGQAGDVLNLTFGEGASVTGAVALTETFHGYPYSEAAIAALDSYGDDVSYVLLNENFEVTAGNEGEAAWIQVTEFSINQYFMLCEMSDHIYNNGYSGINVTVEDGAVWTVASESLINYLKVEGTVYGTLVENADGSLTLMPGADAIPAGEYGTAVEANVSASSGMGNAMGGDKGDSGMPASDDAAKDDGMPADDAAKDDGMPADDAAKDAGAPEGDAGEAMNMADGSTPPDPPADLADGEEPPGGFGGID